MDAKIVYNAAGLFNGRQSFFNIHLDKALSELGYYMITPQIHGFEFNNFDKKLSRKISGDVSLVHSSIIYFLDVGVYVAGCDVALANLDEPVDEGVVTEISYAKLLNKPVVGFRTDVRPGYGKLEEPLGGMHFFPAFQCDYFIKEYMPCNKVEKANVELVNLVKKIDNTIKSIRFREKSLIEQSINFYNCPAIFGASLLFPSDKSLPELVDYIHTDSGLDEIINNYKKNKKELDELLPRIV